MLANAVSLRIKRCECSWLCGKHPPRVLLVQIVAYWNETSQEVNDRLYVEAFVTEFTVSIQWCLFPMLFAVTRQTRLILAFGLLSLAIVGEAQWDCANVFTREYNGTASQACPKNSFGEASCFDCIPWANMTGWEYGPKNGSDTDLMENYCRFVGDKAGPMCYIQTPDGRTGIEFCQTPPCHAHSGCMTGNGTDYRDQAMFTESGYSCLHWDQVQDQDVNSTSYPDAGLDENYCRNPDNSTGPWCYYRDQDMQIRRNFCPIETCESDALSQFQRHYKIYIPANNNRYHRGWWWDMTAEDCARFCLEERTFVCRSFEYREEYYFDDRRCILTDQSLHTLDIYRTTSSGISIDLFTRIDKICDAYQANAIPDECPLQLGMEDGTIPDANITASSSAGPDHGPEHARLGGPSYWKPDPNATTDGGHWLQVCFPSRMLVSGVLIQGGGTGEEAGWVEDFELEYNQEGLNWWKYRDFREFDREPEIMVFRANGEATCRRPVILPTPIRATCIRIIPTLWNHALHLRMDLIGCLDNDCDTVLGLSDGRVLDSQITSSSSSNETNSAKTARLNPLDQQPSTGWVPATSDPQQWLLVDLRHSHDVHALLTQGCGNRELWVTLFRMYYSGPVDDDSNVRFQPYVDQDGVTKDFLANSDQHTIVRNELLPEITTRYVRIDPVMWHPAGIGLRLELVGCVHRACGQRLGMESGAITRSQLSTSSNFYYRPARYGRLHYEIVVPPYAGRYCCWGPRHELGLAEWLQADLGTLHTITGVITQGAGNPWRYYWVEEYKIQWLSPHEEGAFRTYRDLQGDDMIFQGNSDQNSEKRNDLDRPFITSQVRIVPYAWHNITACMRVEFTGCPLEGKGRICTVANLLLDGYCVGSINSQSPDACQEIFSEGSQSLIINSDQLQSRLWEKRNNLLIENQHRYLIGLTWPQGEDSYRWVDSTPLTYNNIRWPLDSHNQSVDYCVSMDSEDLFNWREDECVADHVRKAQICQVDMDECMSVDHGCSHECVNVPGSYYCICPQGFRLNETDLKTCSDICESLVQDLFPIHFEGEGSSCYSTVSLDANWTEAAATCIEANSHLPHAAEDSVFLWLDAALNESLSWALAEVNGSVIDSQCLAVRTDNDSTVVEDIPCSDELPFVCQREYEDVKCNALWASDTSEVKTTQPEGYIQSLSYAPWYDAGSTCTVDIKGPEVYRVRFIISRMNLRKVTPANSQISRCVDSLEITDDIPGYGLFTRGRYCGSLRDVEVVTRSSDVRVVFTIGPLSANMPRELGFVASYKLINCSEEDCTTDCGTNATLLTQPSGVLATKGFPARLPPFSTCIWQIKLPKGQYIRLQFPDFRVVRDSGTGDCVDAVIVTGADGISQSRIKRAGRDMLTGRLCGTPPPQIISESEELYIFYLTGLDVLSEGFRATYTSTDLPGCGVGLHSASSHLECQAPEAVLTSLYHPLPYPAHSHYSWRITTPTATYIQLTFSAFDVPSQTPCDGDFVTIFDGDEELDEPWGEFCNSRRPPGEVLSSMNQMIIEFETQEASGGTGFSAVYRALRFQPKVSLKSPYDEDYSCESGWAEYYGNCYHFHQENATLKWKDAERQCAIEGALLTSIRDYGEMNFLHLMLTSDWFTEETTTYIGLTDIQEEGRFRWLDGRPLSYSDWMVNSDGYTQPDGDVLEDCSMIMMRSLHSTQNWEDIPCSLRAARQFICKKPARKPDGTEHNTSETLGELQTKECDSGWSLAGNLCARLLLATDALPVSPDDSGECLTDVQVTPDLLVSILYLVRRVWTNASLQQEGYRIGVGRTDATGQMWDSRSDPEMEYGGCTRVRYSGGRWEPEEHIPCDSPVSAVVCYQQTRDVTQQCGDSMFYCDTGECIQQVYMCDGVVDCADMSDEAICVQARTVGPNTTDAVSLADSCNSGLFRCAKGGCISLSFLCDFIRQCSDGSDEEHCEYPPCRPSEFTCSNGQCIDGDKQCNIHVDCLDGSDETNCDICRMAFQCYDSSCIPHHAVCDATQDCPGFIREDEAGCAHSTDSDFQCGADQLQCNNGACADTRHWCIYDFDEFGYQTGCRDVTHLRFCEHFTCSAFTYKCPRSYCIPLHRRCDNVSDCPNGEDELSCEPSVCPLGSYKCRSSQVCVNEDQVCNGAKECPLGDDELFCGVDCPDGCQCTGLSFTCVSTDWNQTKADNLPDTLRRLVLSNTIFKGTVQRKRREVSNHNVTLEDILFIRLERFHFFFELDISGNQIEILDPGMFRQQKNLFSLSVANNKLYNLEPGTFEGLRWLQKLDLSGNPLVQIQPGAFHHLQSLPHLDLHGLAISHIYSGTFDGLDSLQRLDLSSNNLSELEAGTFDSLRLVTLLDISNNSLRVFPQDLFSGITSLQTLHSDKYLFCCMVGDIQECTPEPDQFSSCEDLMRNHVLRAFNWILGLSAFLGNAFVVVWRLRTKQRFKVQGLLILNLALSDCLMGVYMLIIAAADVHYRDVYIYFADAWKSSTLCTVAGFLSAFSSEASVFTLTVITLDRFLCIMFPFGRLKLGRKSVRWVIAGTWVLAFLLSIIPALGLPYFGERYYGRSSVCLALPLTSERSPGWEYSIILFLGVNLISILTILVCYTAIYIYAKRSAKQIRSTKGATNELKLATKTFLIIATDMCCWFPIVIMGYLSLSGSVVIPPTVYAWTAVFILPINSSINPYLYTISSIGLPKLLEVSNNYRSHRCHCQDGAATSEIALATIRSNGHHHTVMTPTHTPPTRRKAPSCGRFLLSMLLYEDDGPAVNLSGDDVRSIEVDLRAALKVLHGRGLCLAGKVEDAVVLEKEPTESEWHANLLLPRASQDESSVPVDEDALSEDEERLRDVIQCIKNMLASSSVH
ncbi:uncharacterized protein LOC119737135 [Patiria miniata]|uniref:Uncharacterized protein n=1 Tax=Patiria miniata TaxID=46514 RepID=A0A914ASZ8_PATMI|nr:uncharacterized protein LOC119737135 [Patiria miniata]